LPLLMQRPISTVNQGQSKQGKFRENAKRDSTGSQ